MQQFKDKYIGKLKKSSTDKSPLAVKELILKKRGKPLLIGGELDDQVKEYVTELRREGVVINSDVVIAIEIGIVMKNDANLLLASGGHIECTKHWAKYLFSRMGFVKRREPRLLWSTLMS